VAEGGRGRRGLGRGLSALLGEGAAAAAGPALLELPVDAIDPNPSQPRGRVDEGDLAALAASIRASGVLQPILVTPAGDDARHRLIAGERRWRAARLAGLERVPAVVREADDRERLEFALVENLAREDLTPIEVAQACACLIEDFGQSHGELAGRLGRSRPAVSNLVRLLELPEEIQDMIAAGLLSEGHGRAILMADGRARRLRVAEAAVADGLTVRATEDLARGGVEGRARRRRGPVGAVGDAALEAFGTAFDAPVRVRAASGGQMVVELRFADEAALEAALRVLPPA
jgi:ParB family transcriptional regulator, chromosome partitioning protein